ncbi:aspartyl/glutamyl-tRNA(Asn/Gln) amidotransferase subunit C [Neorhizobium alkalisoli]|uniref:Aspartyl/glutamyl-tRNA(Asn/Gln) amidotransferase subunit C n=2 Tax=Neorhizobium alkalisoli TaxID=528178 RepID=A0A561R1V4_9HYPH|nr:aspartyl/glutamyl-tRNA(Asn/Gln) amidotransferase subunit C [Neorhizobium alkalisoli]
MVLYRGDKLRFRGGFAEERGLTPLRSWCVAIIAGRNYLARSKAMSVDLATVKRVARLARLAVTEEDANRMVGELNGIINFVEQLSEVDVTGVEPMTSVTPMDMRKRHDDVTDGNKADDVVANAPATDRNFFLVPKVVE